MMYYSSGICISIKTHYWQEPFFILRLCSFCFFGANISFLCETVMKIGGNVFDGVMVMFLLAKMKSR